MTDSEASRTDTAATQRREALIAVLLLAPIPSIGVFSAMISPGGSLGHAIFVVCKVWLLALPAVWWWWRESGRPRWIAPSTGPLLVGGVLGFALGASILIGYGLFFESRIDPSALREATEAMRLGLPLPFLAAALYWSFVNSAIEEYVYRWFLLRHLGRLVTPTVAAIASALVFATHHVIALLMYLPVPLAIIGSTGVFVGGLVWAILYQRFRSLWPCWLSHAIVDIAVFSIGWEMVFGGH
ncbi:MAG: CPBP family intramembrane metalloprotease [bacterium]|nr:CPBP family intramembrane metalloprotease [bacterium]